MNAIRQAGKGDAAQGDAAQGDAAQGDAGQMSPRRYQMGVREVGVEATRQRILESARVTLVEAGLNFSLDAVARGAGVARMTVYYQFGSRVGLLQALFDDVGRQGGVSRLREASEIADVRAGLRQWVRANGAFWASQREVLRRLTGLGALDADFAAVAAERAERRRAGASRLIERLEATPAAPGQGRGDSVDLLLAATSFATFDALAGDGRSTAQATALMGQLAGVAVGIDLG